MAQQPQPAPKPTRASSSPDAVDLSDPEKVRQRNDSIKRREDARINGLKVLLADKNGRDWLWDLIGFCGVFRTSFTGNSETFMREGQRNVGLKIIGDLTKHSPDSLIQMMKENQDG